MFFVKSTDGEELCVKFVREYSKEAHLECFSMGFAPALKGFEPIPGGWYMVTMDVVSADYERFDTTFSTARPTELHDAIKDKLVALHQAGFVHGDVRDTNVMVKKGASVGFMLLDFDWAGEIGSVRYPMNVTTGPHLKRPDGAYDGEIIRADHDIEMLSIMFDENN